MFGNEFDPNLVKPKTTQEIIDDIERAKQTRMKEEEVNKTPVSDIVVEAEAKVTKSRVERLNEIRQVVKDAGADSQSLQRAMVQIEGIIWGS